MIFARFVWKLLVAIKDGLVLLLLFVFFGALYAALTVRPNPGPVREGAFYLPLDGALVEERSRISPGAVLLGGEAPRKELLTRDVLRGLRAAADDTRIRAVAIELDEFGGARQPTLEAVGAAMDAVRKAGKPVLVHATLYRDGAYLLAAHASEVWMDPMGGVALSGPGGTQLFYKGLIDKLRVEAHVFRVGTYKDAVEPYMRDGFSPEARSAEMALLGALREDWRGNIMRARPRAQVDRVLTDPVGWLKGAGNDPARAALGAGLVDKLGDQTAFGVHVAELVGKPAGEKHTDAFKRTTLPALLADNPLPTAGKGIAVVTVAGEIVDGDAGPGMAGGDRIAQIIDEAAIGDKYAGMVLRVDSPGGSVMASERIRAALARFKAGGRPVAVSMGGLAASGGYWVSTPAQRIFAEPATVTGSIGVFGVVPSFERTLAGWGVNPDSVRTGPLSGQPDVVGGLTPEASAVVQAEIEQIYGRFLGLVAQSRKKTPQQIDAIAQGRVWDGGTARQIGLVDQFGGIDDALAWTAGQAKLGKGEWHAVWLGGQSDPLQRLLQGMADRDDDGPARAHDAVSAAASATLAWQARLGADLDRLLSGRGAQAYCLECAGIEGGLPVARGDAKGWLAALTGLLR